MSDSYIEYDYLPMCDELCQAAYRSGTNSCWDGEMVFVAQRTVNPPGDWSVQEGVLCLTAAEQLPFDPAQLQAMVDDYFQRIPLPAPELNLAPADNAVVNLPEIVSTTPPGQTTFTVDEAPFPTVTINATVSWEWDFGDGETLSTSSPGRPYTAADPELSHYLTHTYRSANAGWPVSVTAVWTATYTVDGMPGTQSVTGHVRRTTTKSLPAADYGGTLTGR